MIKNKHIVIASGCNKVLPKCVLICDNFDDCVKYMEKTYNLDITNIKKINYDDDDFDLLCGYGTECGYILDCKNQKEKWEKLYAPYESVAVAVLFIFMKSKQIMEL